MSVEFMFPVGRLVSGHPMFPSQVMDNKVKPPVPLKDAQGQPVTERYIGVAITKGTETHWDQTAWGQQIYAAAQDPVEGYVNGEIQRADFSWKIVDGDSTIPNKKGNKPCDQEGYKGCWVVHMTTRIPYACHHVGRYDPAQAIQNKDEIKRGDYCRVYVTVKGNKPSDSPGVYINPQKFELSRAGIEIVSQNAGPSAADVFGGSAPELPPGAAVDASVQTPAHTTTTPPPGTHTPPPAHDLVNVAPPVVAPEPKYSYNGQVNTMAQWLAMPGWTEALVKQHCQSV